MRVVRYLAEGRLTDAGIRQNVARFDRTPIASPAGGLESKVT